MLENRRHNYRIASYEDREQVWTLDINEGELVTRSVVDLSPTGIAFKAPRSVTFQRGQTIQMKLQLGTDWEIDCLGRIVWFRENTQNKGGFGHFGVEFISLKNGHSKTITQKIEEVLSQGIRIQQVGKKNLENIKRLEGAMGLVTAAILMAVFLAASFYYTQRFPEKTLAYQFKNAPFWQSRGQSQ